MPGQIASALIPELQHEAIATRKLLSRLPVDKRDWAPHPKSFTLGRLATHVSQLVGWTGTMSKIQTIRGMCINHFIHHRGQLSLYLRLNDVPLPNLYGPSADEQ